MNNKFVAIIPARGGSKGLPRKNILHFYNKPLINWSIEFAQKAKIFSRCIVSTDDLDIINIAKKCGAEIPYIRDKSLSTDEASSSSVIIDALDRCEIEDDTFIILLEPTSPYRRLKYIKTISSLINEKNAEMIVSVYSASSSSYSYQYELDSESKLLPLEFNDYSKKATRRQDLKSTYFSDGSFYVARASSFRKHNSFFSDNTFTFISDLFSSLEIDNKEDFQLIEALFKTYGTPF